MCVNLVRFSVGYRVLMKSTTICSIVYTRSKKTVRCDASRKLKSLAGTGHLVCWATLMYSIVLARTASVV
jgi:hypothetical protein